MDGLRRWAVHVPWPKRGAGKQPADDPGPLLLMRNFNGEAEAALGSDLARLWVAVHQGEWLGKGGGQRATAACLFRGSSSAHSPRDVLSPAPTSVPLPQATRATGSRRPSSGTSAGCTCGRSRRGWRSAWRASRWPTRKRLARSSAAWCVPGAAAAVLRCGRPCPPDASPAQRRPVPSSHPPAAPHTRELQAKLPRDLLSSYSKKQIEEAQKKSAKAAAEKAAAKAASEHRRKLAKLKKEAAEGATKKQRQVAAAKLEKLERERQEAEQARAKERARAAQKAATAQRQHERRMQQMLERMRDRQLQQQREWEKKQVALQRQAKRDKEQEKRRQQQQREAQRERKRRLAEQKRERAQAKQSAARAQRSQAAAAAQAKAAAKRDRAMRASARQGGARGTARQGGAAQASARQGAAREAMLLTKRGRASKPPTWVSM